MCWLVALLLTVICAWLLKANDKAERRWRALRYSWTKLGQAYSDVPDTGAEWPEIAQADLNRHSVFLRQFDIVPLSAAGMALYEEALAEREMQPID